MIIRKFILTEYYVGNNHKITEQRDNLILTHPSIDVNYPSIRE